MRGWRMQNKRQALEENRTIAPGAESPSRTSAEPAPGRSSAWTTNPAKMPGAIFAGLVTGLIAWGVEGAAEHIHINVRSERHTVAIIISIS